MRTAILALAALATLLLSPPARAEDAALADRSAQAVYGVFARTCSPCHSQRERRPKGDFGYVLDLERLSRAGEWVVRGRPEASKLYDLIADDEMPPSGSRYGPLSEEDRATVWAWIQAGAPGGPVDLGAFPDLPPVAQPTTSSRLAGLLHRVLVHFPVALLLAAALAEALFAVQDRKRLRGSAEFCLALGTAGAVAATLTGWYWAGLEGYALTTHRWLGVATTLFALAACAFAATGRRPDREPSVPRRPYRLALLAAAVTGIVTGFLGGEITHAASHVL